MVESPNFSVLHYVQAPTPIVHGDAFPSWAYQMLFVLSNEYDCWQIRLVRAYMWGWVLYNGKDEVDNRVIILPIDNGYVASQCFKLEVNP